MSSDDFVIRVEGLGKAFQVYESPRARLQQFLVPRLRRWLGLAPRDYYREFHALADISFRVRPGETVGVIGRNGSGKSTLLQLVCGTLSPSAGEVEVRGRVAALLELGSGFNPEFTGRENVQLYAALLGLSRRQVQERFQDIERFAAIGEFIDQPVKTYSSGMVVRLAFAVAIHVDPDVLVVDEALAVGDTAFQQKCLNRIRALQEKGVSILLVTHSANTLIEYCDRGIYLKRGRLVMDGPCIEAVRAYGNDLIEEEGGLAFDLLPPQAAQAVDVAPDGSAAPAVAADAGGPAPALAVEQVSLLGGDGQPAASVRHGDTLVVEFLLRANAAIAEPCFGIQLASTDGIALWSAVTSHMGLVVSPLAPGRYRFRWRLKADFSGNRYVVALGAGHLVDGEYKRIHRIDYAGHFDVLPTPRSGAGWLAPKPAFESPEAGIREAGR